MRVLSTRSSPGNDAKSALRTHIHPPLPTIKICKFQQSVLLCHYSQAIHLFLFSLLHLARKYSSTRRMCKFRLIRQLTILECNRRLRSPTSGFGLSFPYLALLFLLLVGYVAGVYTNCSIASSNRKLEQLML